MGFIFDLDGTLLNSIRDLGDAMNRVLERHNFPTHSPEIYKTYVGNGLRKLVERSLPPECDSVDIYHQEFLDEYGAAYCNESYLYEGIFEMLKKLNNLKIPIAIHTNKMQVYTDTIISHYLEGIEFVTVVGDQSDGLHKPNPHHTLKIVEVLNCDTMYFVGDSDVDMKTALNANLIPVGVSWGFRSVDELVREGAHHIVDTCDELLELVK